MQEHDVNVARWIQFAPPVAAKGDQSHRLFLPSFAARRRDRCRENMLQKNVHQLDAELANFTTTTASLMSQTKPVLLDLEEALVKRQDLRRSFRPGRGKLILRVGQELGQVAQHSDKCPVLRALLQTSRPRASIRRFL